MIANTGKMPCSTGECPFVEQCLKELPEGTDVAQYYEALVTACETFAGGHAGIPLEYEGTQLGMCTGEMICNLGVQKLLAAKGEIK